MPQDFPCQLSLHIPFPTARLASVALKALAVDKELSPLVRRAFSTVVPEGHEDGEAEATVLKVDYSATTNRMLRVALTSFMDTLRLVMEVMEKLDVDVALAPESVAQQPGAA